MQSGSSVSISKSYSSEHKLVAGRTFACGDLVVAEEPLVHLALKSFYPYGDYCWRIVELLLAEAGLFKQFRALKLHANTLLLDESSLAVEAHLVGKYRKSRQLVRGLYFAIGTNNIGILTPDRAVKGYGIFPLLSRADHSCAPNTRLLAGTSSTHGLELRATQNIRPGDPITWSYFREDEFLSADFHSRNEGLVNYFRFACRCSRCRADRPPELTGVKDLLAYYDLRIREQAKELAKTPQGLRQALAETPLARHQQAYLASRANRSAG